MKKTKRKRNIPKEPQKRILIYGVHPVDNRIPKKVYCFWASIYLMEQFPCVGDLVRVNIDREFKDVRTKSFRTILYVTDVQQWQDGMYEPTSIANFLYEGEKFRDFEYEIEE